MGGTPSAKTMRVVGPGGCNARWRRFGCSLSSMVWKRRIIVRREPDGWVCCGANVPVGRRVGTASVGGSGYGRFVKPAVNGGKRVLVSWSMRSAVRSTGVSPISPGFAKAHFPLPPVNAYVLLILPAPATINTYLLSLSCSSADCAASVSCCVGVIMSP